MNSKKVKYSETKRISFVHVKFYLVESFQNTFYIIKVNAITFMEVKLTCKVNFVRQEHVKKNMQNLCNTMELNMESKIKTILKAPTVQCTFPR